MRGDDELVTCPPNAEHGHPDAPRETRLRFIRFLDCLHVHVNPASTLDDDPTWSVTRTLWEATFGGVARDDLPEPGCWGYAEVRGLRPLLWGDE